MNVRDEVDDIAGETPDVPAWVTHPGLAWLDDAACRFMITDDTGNVDKDSIKKFFVAAGHVITVPQKQMCTACPVRRECLIHAFIGSDGKSVTAGYLAGFSSGQRNSTPFEQLYAQVEEESRQYRLYP